MPLPNPVTFYSPDTLRLTCVATHRYRFVAEIKHPTDEAENVMAIDSMPDDLARQVLADLVASINRSYAKARR